jgi:murein DD-endopeptidase MepM/ murein hydrolase activator NlpD
MAAKDRDVLFAGGPRSGGDVTGSLHAPSMPVGRHPTAGPRRPTAFALALVLGAAALASAPAWASTASELSRARDRLETARAELDRADARWQEAEARLARSQDAAAQARARIGHLDAELILIRRSLNDRVAAAFMSGGSMSLGALLTADSIQDATDRLQYAQSVVQGDADLATEVSVKTEELRRQETRLRKAARAEAAATEALESQRDQIGVRVGDLNRIVDELKAELTEQAQVQLGLGGGSVVVRGSGAIQTCPVAGATSFVDSFGWPRPGGRTHQGIDLIAAYGTPVVAVAPGTARSASNTLGGNAVVLQHDSGGDWTYYAHLSSFGASGHVSAGTVIGHVGATGDTNVNHLHFEYHPNGGAAVNPYSALLAVC